MTPYNNFAKVTVSTTYTSADITIVLTAGHGSRLPSTFPFPLVWWDATSYADPADDPNREIVICTARSTDTLTVTRAGESTSASNKNTAGKTYKMLAGLTKGGMTELQSRGLSQTFRGLQLSSHPDNDMAATKVRLIHADAIVMSDGEEVATWDDVDFNIAAAVGIGGLDSGTEQLSTWYKLFAMYNGTTKGLMAQRAKDYLLDTSYTAGEDATQGCRSAVDNSTVKISQGLQFATAGPLEFVDVKLIAVGSPVGNIWFTLESNNAGVPSGTVLATSDKINAANYGATSVWTRVVFRTPYTVSAATQYHLVMQGDYAVNAANYIGWRMDGSAGAYASGSKALFDYDTATWTADADDDLQFKAYITENDSALVVPTGYRYAHIGWAYNNSLANVVPFRQYNRRWEYADMASGLLVNETASTATLVDTSSVLPPITSTARFSLTGTGAAAASASLGDIKAMPLNTAGGPFTVSIYTGATSEFPSAPAAIILEYNGLMIDAGAGADLYVNGFEW